MNLKYIILINNKLKNKVAVAEYLLSNIIIISKIIIIAIIITKWMI